MNGIDTLITEFETVAGYHSAIGSFLFDRMSEINSQKTSTGDSNRVYPLLLIDSDQTTASVNRSLNNGLPKRKEYSVRVILCDEYDQTEQASTDLEAKFQSLELILHQYLAKVYRRSTESFTKIIINPDSLENNFIKDHGSDILVTVGATVTAYVDSENCDNGTFTDLPSPTALSATSGSVSVDLSWTDNSSTEDGFEIYRSTSLNTGFTLLTTTASDATTYSDTSGTLDQTYFYKVRAIDGSVTSGYSNIVAGTLYSAACDDATATLNASTLKVIASGASGAITIEQDSVDISADCTTDGLGKVIVPLPTNIIYQRPSSNMQSVSYFAGDAANNDSALFNREQGVGIVQQLDRTQTPFRRYLKYDSPEFGNKFRITNSSGADIWGLSDIIRYDHLQGIILDVNRYRNDVRTSFASAVAEANAKSMVLNGKTYSNWYVIAWEYIEPLIDQSESSPDDFIGNTLGTGVIAMTGTMSIGGTQFTYVRNSAITGPVMLSVASTFGFVFMAFIDDHE